MATFTYLARLTGAGNPTTLTFSSIPSTYQDLVVFGNFSTNNTANTNYQTYMSFNGAPAGSSYYSYRFGTIGASTFNANQSSGANSNSYIFDGSNNYTNRFTQFQLYIPQYAAGSNVRSHMGWEQFAGNTASNYFIQNFHNGLWNVSTAINSIRFTQSDGFTTGTILTLYGISKS